MDNQIRKTVLDSGLAIMTGAVPEGTSNNVHINISINSGASDDEVPGQAHFLEHMAFNGIHSSSGIIDFRTLKQTRESRGITLSAYTNHIETNYQAAIPVHLGQQGIAQALEELSGMLISPTLPEDRIAHEKRVICNEWGSRQGKIDTYTYEQAQKQVHRSNPAFSHRVLGEKEDVRSITRQDLLNFIQDHYTQPNIVVSVAGTIDHDEVVQMISDYFKQMPSHDRPALARETPIQSAYQAENIGFLDHSFSQIILPWKGADNFDDEMVSNISAMVISNALNDEIREEGGNVYGLSAGHLRYRQTGKFMIGTDSEPETIEGVTRQIGSVLSRLSRLDISSEVSIAKTSMRNYLQGVMYDTEAIAYQLSSEHTTYGKVFNPEVSLAQINQVDPSQVQAAIRKSMLGPKAFIGLGVEGSFLSEPEFDQTMTLPPLKPRVTLKAGFAHHI